MADTESPTIQPPPRASHPLTALLFLFFHCPWLLSLSSGSPLLIVFTFFSYSFRKQVFVESYHVPGTILLPDEFSSLCLIAQGHLAFLTKGLSEVLRM